MAGCQKGTTIIAGVVCYFDTRVISTWGRGVHLKQC